MNKKTPSALISIVIPCYNAELFIADTLDSIFRQSYANFEVIVIDDGSTDGSAAILAQYGDPRLQYHYQTNAGVSNARNKGLSLAQGDFIVFFDCDDQMLPQFIQKRVNFLLQNPHSDFCTGALQTFPLPHQQVIESLYSQIIEHLVRHTPNLSTCPSAYLFRRESLIKHSLLFDLELSSTADRFFLAQAAKAGLKGGTTNDADARLLYRIHPQSMSHRFSLALTRDNELFYQKMLNTDIITENTLRREMRFISRYILGGSYKKLGFWQKSVPYLLLSFVSAPFKFVRRWQHGTN